MGRICKKSMTKHRKGRRLKGSMTVEMSFLLPIILLLIMSSILATFYFHDKNILSGAAYETAVVGSTKMREREQISPGELEVLFRERVGRKCILFAGSSVKVQIGKQEICVEATAHKGRFGISVIKKAAVTQPEDDIRDKRRIKEITNGTEDHN